MLNVWGFFPFYISYGLGRYTVSVLIDAQTHLMHWLLSWKIKNKKY